MINLNKFDESRGHDTTSWAVWSEDGDNSVGFFRSKLNILHGKAIFVGLNRSNSWSGPSNFACMANFHAPGHVGDRRLKRQIQAAKLSNLMGGLMTDVSEVIETNSGDVIVDPALSTTAFTDKVIGIDEASVRQIICFGDKVFDTFKKGLGIKRHEVEQENFGMKLFQASVRNEAWHFYRVWHYSNYGKLLYKSETELPAQLELINTRLV